MSLHCRYGGCGVICVIDYDRQVICVYKDVIYSSAGDVIVRRV